jgi:uncharacterized protein (DUF302 family)
METNQFIIEQTSPYNMDKTVEMITEKAKELNWSVPFVHDLQQSLAKSGKEVKPVKVIEICKPEYSGKMLEFYRLDICNSPMNWPITAITSALFQYLSAYLNFKLV